MLESFGVSDPGRVRNNNEDSFLVDPQVGLYLVADGMGGAQAGERASHIATETLREIVHEEEGGMNAAKLITAFHEANRRIKLEASTDSKLEGMGTTLVVAVESAGDLLIASVGDSRAYQLTDGAFTQITEDQSWINEVGRRLGLAEEVLKVHPMRHVLTMAIGVSENLRVNSYTVPLAPSTIVLICSDGLHGVVGEDNIAAVLRQDTTLEVRAKRLIELARDQGAPDNVTAVLIKAQP
ncbi:MAG: protein phosphatase 2C domain-containing protein [Acidobacteriota bacterium]